MKILYVYFHSYSDMPYHVREWVEAALELGHEVTVVTAIDPAFLASIDWDKKVDVRQIEYPGCGIRNFFKLQKNFKQVVSNIVSREKPDLIYERFSSISMATAKVAEKTEIPYAVEVNGIIENELALSGASLLRQHFFKYIQKKVYSKCSTIITVTEQIKEWIIKQYSMPENKIKTFNNGVNINRFKPCDRVESGVKFNLPKDKFIVGFLGSLYPWNGLQHLIAAAEILIKEKEIFDILFLIGGGQEPMKSELEKMVEEKELSDYFIFSGQIKWKDAPEYISAFDVAVLPADFTHLPSGISPQKLYSYLACGKPVIASNITGLKEFFEQFEVGMLFKSGNFVNLAEKICEFRKLPENKICEFRKNARECVEKNYSWEKIVKKSLEWIANKEK